MRWTKYTKTEPLRFLFMGGVNTLFSYLVYLIALLAASPKAAYTISFIAGVLTSYLLHLKITFRTTHSRQKIILYPLIYIAQYFIGLLILTISITAGFAKELAPIFVIIVNVPLSFFVGRFVLRLS